MASSKNVLRSFLAMAAIFGAGLLGLWLLGGNKAEVKNPVVSSAPKATGVDEFSDVGGRTPRETINLLTAALEKNNIALSLEYFSPENRSAASDDLANLASMNLLSDLIKNLKSLKDGKTVDDIHYVFEVSDESGSSPLEITLIKNEKGFWKILSM